ncbi:MAG: hypothetical protein AB7I50_20360 [Vicinamibacterales bacterium]
MLESIEQVGVLTWVRESNSVWAFASVLMFHTLGFSVLAGISVMLSLRLLGFGKGIPIAPLERLFPLATAGLVTAALTGVTLALVEATTRLVSPVLYVKLVLLVFALLTMRTMRNEIFRNPLVDRQPLPPNAKRLAIVSLLLWLSIVTAGRLIGYTLGA